LYPIVKIIDSITAYTDFAEIHVEHIPMMTLRFIPSVIDTYWIRVAGSNVLTEIRPWYGNDGRCGTAVRPLVVK
jgi:hypothetical protein